VKVTFLVFERCHGTTSYYLSKHPKVESSH